VLEEARLINRVQATEQVSFGISLKALLSVELLVMVLVAVHRGSWYLVFELRLLN